jgi:hypothetical protein
MSWKIENTVLDCPYIDDILCALTKVTSDYIIYPCFESNKKKRNKKAENGEENNQKYRYPERVFAYEFYHQYRRIMECKKEKYAKLFLNGEQPKSSRVWEGLSAITPDIVLHGKNKEADYTGKTQKWLCEIKMNGNPKMIEDLKKIKEKEKILKFNDNIFICIGCDLNHFKTLIDEANLKKEDIDERTICIFALYSDKDIEISCKRLSEIMFQDTINDSSVSSE